MDIEELEQDYADFYSNVLSDKHYESLAQMNYSQLTDELNRVHKVLAPSTESEKKQVAAFKRKMRKEWRQLCKQAAEKDPMGSEPVLSEVETPLSGAGVVPVLQQQQQQQEETLVPEQVAVVAEEEEEAVIQVIDLTGEQEQEEEEEEEEEEEVPERHVKVEVWEEEVPDNLLVSQFLLGLATGTLMGCGLCLFIMLSILLLRGGGIPQ